LWLGFNAINTNINEIIDFRPDSSSVEGKFNLASAN